jgi:hypothetical protein
MSTRQFVCPWESCSESFDAQVSMRIHHAKKHGESIAYEELKCEVCGDSFEVHTSRVDEARFCSESCNGKWREENIVGSNHPRWKDDTTTELECDYCCDVFTREESAVNEHNFCDTECLSNWRSEYFSGKDNPYWDKGDVEVAECSYCGNEVRLTKRGRIESNHNFCDRGCYAQWQKEVQTKEEHPCWKDVLYTSITDAVRNTYSEESWSNISESFRSKSNGCEICSASKELIVHHIVPIQSGGTNGKYNLMCLCKSCHRSVESYTQQFTEPHLTKFVEAD